jgi:cation:H+ antiporter
LAFSLYIFYSLKNGANKNTSSKKKQNPSFKEILLIFLSPVGIFFGAKYTVDSVIFISAFFGIGSEIIALSAIALGTSLPEVLVTIAAARRGNPELAVGNIIGSNIFNGLVVMGIPSLITNLTIPPGILAFALPVSIVAIFIFIFMIIDKKINSLEGGILLIFYIYFISKLFGLTG